MRCKATFLRQDTAQLVHCPHTAIENGLCDRHYSDRKKSLARIVRDVLEMVRDKRKKNNELDK